MSSRPDGHADEASPDETVVSQEPEDAHEEEFDPFDEVQGDFAPGPAVRVTGDDGMPVTVDQSTHSDIPALSTESLICMGDYGMFVRRDDYGQITDRFDAKDVIRTPDGRWFLKADLERTESGALSWPIDPVEPIRPPCKHYVRQSAQMALNAAHKQLYRLCSARRTTEGTFMTVRDMAVWACDMREPVDLPSIEEMDAFDRKKIQEGKTRVFLPIVGPAQPEPRRSGVGGIFGPAGSQEEG